MRLDSSGNLGLGTTSPGVKLDVVGTAARVSSSLSTGPTLFLNNTSGTAFKSQITFTSSGTGKFSFGLDPAAVGTNNLFWYDEAAAATRMTLDASGNLGIGTTSPGAKLQVGDAGSTAPVKILIRSASADTYLQSTSTGSVVGTPNNVPLLFNTNDSERMRLDSSGRLLLGSTTPDVNLGATGFQITSAQTCQIIQCTDAIGQAVRFYSSTSTQAGFITVSGATASYNSASDYRLKENVTPLVGALAIVNGLRPVKYTWKVDGCDGEGFIAHELQESIPLAVQGTKDQLDNEGNISPQGIDQSKIVPYLVKAMQEQQSLIQSLTDRIAQLEAK
jgi:hypothetical protein